MLPSLSKEGRIKSAKSSVAQHMASAKDNEVREKLRLYKLDDLQRELDVKNTSISALQRNYEALTFAHREEKRRLEEAEARATRLTVENQSLLTQLKETRDRFDQKNTEASNLKQENRQLVKLQDELNKLKSDSANSKLALSSKLKDSVDKDKIIREIRQELELTRSNSLQLKEQLKELHSKCLVYKNKGKEAEAQLVAVHNQAEQLSEALEATQSQLIKYQQETTNFLADLAELRTVNQQISQKLAAEKDEFAKQRTKYAELMKYCNELKASNEGHNLLLVSSAHSETEMRKRLDKAEAVSNELNAQLEDLKLLKENEAKDQHAYYGLAIAELNAKVIQQNSTIDDLSKSLTETSNRLAFLQDDRKRLDLRVKDLEGKTQQESQSRKTELLLTEQLRQCEEEYKKGLKAKDDIIAELEARSENLESENKDNQLTLKHLNSRLKDLSNLEKTAREMAEQLHYNRNSHHLLSSQLSGLLEEKDQLELQVKTLQHSSSAVQNRLSEENLELQSEKERLLDSLQEMAGEIRSIQKSLQDREEQLRIMQSEVERASSASDTTSRTAKNEVETIKKELFRVQFESNHKIQSIENDLHRTAESLKALLNVKSDHDILKGKMEVALQKVRVRQNTELMKDLDSTKLELKTQLATRQHEANDRRELMSRIEILKAQLESCQAKAPLEAIVKSTVEKVRFAVEALESELSCNSCQDILDTAIVCVPCGHYYCTKCTNGYRPACRHCTNTTSTMSLPILDNVIGKLGYNKQVLDDALHLVA